MEQENVDLAPSTKRFKGLAAKKDSSKKSFSSVFNFTKTKPFTKTSKVTSVRERVKSNLYEETFECKSKK